MKLEGMGCNTAIQTASRHIEWMRVLGLFQPDDLKSFRLGPRNAFRVCGGCWISVTIDHLAVQGFIWCEFGTGNISAVHSIYIHVRMRGTWLSRRPPVLFITSLDCLCVCIVHHIVHLTTESSSEVSIQTWVNLFHIYSFSFTKRDA